MFQLAVVCAACSVMENGKEGQLDRPLRLAAVPATEFTAMKLSSYPVLP